MKDKNYKPFLRAYLGSRGEFVGREICILFCHECHQRNDFATKGFLKWRVISKVVIQSNSRNQNYPEFLFFIQVLI